MWDRLFVEAAGRECIAGDSLKVRTERRTMTVGLCAALTNDSDGPLWGSGRGGSGMMQRIGNEVWLGYVRISSR